MPAAKTTSKTKENFVSDQDLRNGLGSLLQFVSEGFRLYRTHGEDAAKNYLNEVAKDIISGKGHPAPSPGPVTPDN